MFKVIQKIESFRELMEKGRILVHYYEAFIDIIQYASTRLNKVNHAKEVENDNTGDT
jgi:hypothetical protein